MNPLANRVDAGHEAGYTLVELLATMAVGTVVLLAVFGLLDAAATQSARVQDRVDNVQRGRLAMEFITQDLRSQVCLGPDLPAITEGTDSAVTFYADIGSDDLFNPDRYRLVYNATAKTITEYQYQGTGTPPTTTFPTTPTRTHLVLENVVPVSGVPIFRYYGFTPNPATPDLLQTTPLDVNPTSASLNASNKTVKVAISFVARPTRAKNSGFTDSTFQNYVYVRTADPTDPDHSPRCS